MATQQSAAAKRPTATKRRASREPASPAPSTSPSWTFLSNHGHVILCLHKEPELTLREVAQRVGVTERSVQRILAELEAAGYLERERVGLRNRYRFHESAPLRHPIESHCSVGDLIEIVEGAGRG